ncbi:HAUS augmin-like complex subunit 8 isoform X3 [Grus americana]|uniref:HAUS augmin-like complex subunit 8 isoform X3 n=1 Tax=Grus americana TaxID=9117 RepID=UPI0024089182|nr:HAUS augmin-like complex subunit 8 isoform X3 [Grus americana]
MAAEAAGGMSVSASDSSNTVAGGEVSKNKRKGGRIVKSRYLQYDKKDTKKDTSVNSFSVSTAKSSFATKPRSVPPQKCKTSTGGVSSSLNQSSFEKGDLQSTLLGEDKISRPDLDLSAINDKTVRKKTPGSKSAGDTGTRRKPKKVGNNSDALMEELESQTLLLTYLRVKMEILSPLIPVCEQFKDQYKNFAVSLDATRHELPIKNIHIEGDTLTYLDELQKQLTITQELLTEVTPNYSEDSAKAFSVLTDLKEVSQKLEKELQRSFTQVQNLSFEVSKEVSLHNQGICEENHGLDVVKHWYFN